MIEITKLTGEANHAEDLPLTETIRGTVECFEIEKDNPAATWKRSWQISHHGLVCKSSTGGYLIIPLSVLGSFVAAADANLRPPPMPQ
jgi:hypothetical protein